MLAWLTVYISFDMISVWLPSLVSLTPNRTATLGREAHSEQIPCLRRSILILT